jgi:diguanylate cyclase (GGDEF)-like protein
MQISFQPFLNRQIPVLILLSVFPGLGYIALGWLHDVHRPAVLWYLGVLMMSAWGYRLHRSFDPERMSRRQRLRWHNQVLIYFYLFFALWTVIFVIYAGQVASNLHYIAIFTQIGATTVAAALLFPEPRLFKPIIPIKSAVLVIYFAGIGEWYSYVLSVFSAILGWVLYYSASNSHRLLVRTHHQAIHDMLTGLYNRQHFVEQLQQTINSLRESGQHSYLMLIDLDYFKTVNDSLGHDLGDHLLQEVAARLRHTLPATELLARLGGDEFIVIGSEMADAQACQAKAQQLAQRVLDNLKATYQIQEHQIHISASIGIRLIRAGEDAATHLVREADIAMYEAKAAGRDGVFVFSEAMCATVEQHLEIERLLHFALEHGEISLHYQPQLDSARKLVGAECLVRWHNAHYGDIPPDQFIPVAEKTGLIIELGTHIMTTAFKALQDWHDKGVELQQLAINISVRQFMHHGFVDTVKHLADLHLAWPLRSKIVFEITESLVAEDIDRIVGIMEQLKDVGIRFSMDDFGTGYSSLSSLKQLPIDEVKIDRQFVTNLESDADNQAMVITILSIARFFSLTVVAEGIEDEAQFQFLRDYRCEMFQGFHFARPMPEAAFLAFYNDNRKPD